jgi:hypothetical protein
MYILEWYQRVSDVGRQFNSIKGLLSSELDWRDGVDIRHSREGQGSGPLWTEGFVGASTSHAPLTS